MRECHFKGFQLKKLLYPYNIVELYLYAASKVFLKSKEKFPCINCYVL